MALLIALLVAVGPGQANAEKPPIHATAGRTHRHTRRHHRHRAGSGPARVSIIGGKAAEYRTFPWMAYVHYASPGESFNCSGTVVAPTLVLTAGHCAEDTETGTINEAGKYLITTGSVNWESSERELSTVSRVLVYPNYHISGSLEEWGDAALLQLPAPIKAPAIGLARSEIWRPGTEAIIAGWGKTYYEQTSPTERLRWAITVVQSKEWCSTEASGFHPLGEICTIEAPYYETGTCEGDSGGPLVALRPGTEELVEIGVTAFVYGECSTFRPDVFTRSDLIASWVDARITELSPPPPPPPPAETSLRMTGTEAKGLVRRGLIEDFHAKFKRRQEYQVKCKRANESKWRCSVSWYHRPDDYWGSVTVYYFDENSEVVWNDRYAIHWVNDHCYYHTSHWRSCHVGTRRR